MVTRNPRLFVFLTLFLVVGLPVGCTSGESGAQQAASLRVLLPEHEDYPDRERFAKLTVDDKDVSKRGEKTREVQAAPKPGKKTVSVSYAYWVTSYEKVIRTREVEPLAGQTVEVDLRKPDPKFPDRVEPIFYPTPHEVVTRMMEMGQVGPKDVVYDLGCGDGRLVLQAVKQFKAQRGVGLDIDPDLVKLCKKNAEKDGVAEKVEFRQEDVLKVKDYSDASVVVLYVGDELGTRLSPILRQSLKPGARIVSHRFKLGDWEPDKTVQIRCKNNDGSEEDYTLHLWTVKGEK